MNHSCNLARQRGFTLLEMMIVIVVTGAIVAAACTMLVATTRTNQALTAQLRQRHTFDRLDAQLRRDLHAAELARLQTNMPSAGESVLVLTAQDARIEYHVTPERILRRQLDKQGEVIRSEQYIWAQPLNAKWDVEQSGQGVLTLSFTSADAEQPLDTAWRALTISGQVGSDHRFAKAQEP